MNSSAHFSPCGLFRYWLTREWGTSPDTVGATAVVCQMNPSKAGHVQEDPTSRRTISLVQGIQSMRVTQLIMINPFARIATYPEDLEAIEKNEDRIGPENDFYIKKAAEIADIVIIAWGTRLIHRPWFRERTEQVKAMLREGGDIHYFALSKDGHPRHLLMLPKYIDGTTTPLQPQLWTDDHDRRIA